MDIDLRINHIRHHFLPKLFVELLTMKYVLCHLHSGAYCRLQYSISSKPIRDGYFLLDAMFFQNMILCSNCISTKALELLEFLQALPFRLQHVHPHLPQEIVKYLVPPMDMVLMKSHTPECSISKGLVVYLPSSLENVAMYCLPLRHASQTNEDVAQGILLRLMLLTMFIEAQ